MADTMLREPTRQAGTLQCKVCGAPAPETFRVPASKKSGHPFPDLPDDCPYYECTRCGFCFSTHIDDADHTEVYDDDYWENQDPDWYGRVSETIRLVLLANRLLGKQPDELEVLDFGCGAGTFVETCRKSLQLKAWGTDINPPKFGKEFFLPKLDRKFDIITACEVIEHIPTPRETLRFIRDHLVPGGVFAFQTAEYDRANGRNWWYVGPDNGHISLYSRGALDWLFKELGGTDRLLWRDYPGVQAWQFGSPEGGGEHRRRLLDLEARCATAERELAAMRASTSWSLTAPVRALGSRFRRGSGGRSS